MTDWGSLIEEEIKKAIGDGRLGNLPGAGKPLKLDDNPYTPDDLRLSYKILLDNDLAPEWILIGRSIEERSARLLENMQRGLRAYKGALNDAYRAAITDAAAGQHRHERAEATWQRAIATFEEAAAVINNEILNYNLKVPQGISHKANFNVQRQIKRLIDAQAQAHR
ncbi:MAG: DUF1992 domain-containing protein [Burkholderiales bacterium]|nr:DUF1992 domain-containing protein [Anaerolineae bacterium]